MGKPIPPDIAGIEKLLKKIYDRIKKKTTLDQCQC